jgi:hypothetical protein
MARVILLYEYIDNLKKLLLTVEIHEKKCDGYLTYIVDNIVGNYSKSLNFVYN